jgi:hypothetical protein
MRQDRRRELTTVAESKYWTEAEGRIAVTAWRASSETAAQFGEQHGLAPRRLRWWDRRLGKTATLASTTDHRTVELVPIGLIQRESDRDAEIEIAVGEFKIRVRRGADREALRTVVEVLRSC